MEDLSITIKDDFIKLGQAMKLAGIVGSGVDAKFLIQDGQVKVIQEEVRNFTLEIHLNLKELWF